MIEPFNDILYDAANTPHCGYLLYKYRIVSRWSVSHSSSESRKAIKSYLASFIPLFLAQDTPWFFWRISRMSGEFIFSTISGPSSVEPSSTTIISNSFTVCPRTELMLRVINFPQLYRGIITLIILFSF